MYDIIAPFGLILVGLMGLTIYILTIAVKQLTNQITKTNEKLMILIASNGGGTDATRALTALARPPQGNLVGVSKEKKPEQKKKEGLSMTMGVS